MSNYYYLLHIILRLHRYAVDLVDASPSKQIQTAGLVGPKDH